MERYKPKRIFYVYAFFRPDTGEPCYIGKGHKKRWLHKARGSNNKYLKSLFKKFGGDLPRVKLRMGLTEPEAFAIEIMLIKVIGRHDQGLGPLANATDGGEGTVNISAESRASLARKTKARMADPIARAIIGRQNKERQSDPKVRAECRERMLAQHKDPIIGPLLQKGHAGYPHKEETLVVLRDKALERMADPANRENISRTLLGGTMSPESSEKKSLSLLAYWDERRQKGLPLTTHSAKGEMEIQRRANISITMLAYHARIRDIEYGDDIQ